MILAECIGIFGTDRMILARRRFRKAVTGRRGSIDELGGAGLAGALKDLHGALGVDRHIFDRLFDRWHDVANSGEVKYPINALEYRSTRRQRADIGIQEMKFGVAGMMREIHLAPTHQIVDHSNFVTAIEKQIDNVASDEAGAAGDDGNLVVAHATSTVFIF